ncbi:recombination protein RecT [Alkalibacterium subtropicum]|uniref:Recombination protein RecT n=1 Tax=Alkalibacterium subtropicum TaxID=753702 RepID=A0A1I1EUE5_9LACT|nr:recombinase RecT [Alkalibacterium subtropicum]SFB90256.1 recombination protein RecT [Alkalibacterium subtropicum]
MATNSSLKNQISKSNGNNQVSNAKQMTLKSLLSSPAVQKRFEAVLEEKASGFTTSLLNMVNGDPNLAEAQPMSIITSAMVAATLDLPIDKNLGYAYIVPFRDWKKGNEKVAQFQLGYKGYIQLAQRSGQYMALNVTEVYEGELKSWNRLTEEFEFDPEGKESDEVIGYVAYFRLVNGFEKTVYWTKQQVEMHRVKHNKSKNKEQLTGVWKSDYDAMAQKTVLKSMLSKWGILSIEMQKAVTTDETVQEMDEKGELKQAEMIEDDEPVKHIEESSDKESEDELTELFKDGTITPSE